MECPNRNKYCFLCSLLITNKRKNNNIQYHIERYESHFVAFDIIKYEGEKWFVPNVMCEGCARLLRGGDTVYRKFDKPAIWYPITETHDKENCYFCVSQTRMIGVKFNDRKKAAYAEIGGFSPPVKRSKVEKCTYVFNDKNPEGQENDPSFIPADNEQSSDRPLMNQNEFNGEFQTPTI